MNASTNHQQMHANISPEQLEQENKEILKRYRHLLRAAHARIKPGDTKIIKAALNMAVDAHRNVRRKSGEPYIYHPIEVARIVTEEMGLGTTSIIAALLHDVVEDSSYELSEIEKQFGKKVARIVDGLTKVPTVFGEEKSKQAETFRKVLLSMSEDIRVVLVKIADRLHNMRTLDSMAKDKQLKIKAETQFLYAPIAHRLGFYNIKSELDDLCLKFSNKSAYENVLEKIRSSKVARDLFIKDFIIPIRVDLNRIGIKFIIKSRLKSVSSIWNKMQKQQIPFEEVYDLFAIRIIAQPQENEDEKALCWRIYSTVTDHYQPNTKRTRDWISYPKSNGYESLQTTVMSKKGQWVEVQIRTTRMDDIAEKGFAAHFKYKGTHDKLENNLEKWLSLMRDNVENNTLSDLEFMDEVRDSIFNDEIYVFTPKGDLRIMPLESTVLDFAFEIHSAVGSCCLGAKVNNKLVPLNYELQTGDQVEILKSSKPKITEDWLNFVKTTKAKNKIKSHLRNEQKAIIEQGREVVQRKLAQLKLPASDIVIFQIVDFFNLITPIELYQKVGMGLIPHNEIKSFYDNYQKTKGALTQTKEVKAEIKRKTDSDELIIGETSDFEYSFSSCCNPIPGDDIFGIITVSRGIRIHRTQCANAVSIMASYGERILKTRWAKDTAQKFEVGLHIEGTDRVGLVNDVTRVISSQLKINISSLTISTSGNVFDGKISLGVQNTDQMRDIIRQLESIEGVLKVNRYEP